MVKIKSIKFSDINDLNMMDIYNAYYETPKYFKVDCIETYISYVLKLSESYYNLVFRGEPDIYKDTISSVLRNKSPMCLPDTLKKYYYSEIAHSLIDIERDNFLSYSQHHGLPTELLDITKIPLYALYFACSENVDVNIGVVHIFNIEQSLDLSLLEINEDFINQLFDINNKVYQYYIDNKIDNFFEVFVEFLHRNSTYTRRLVGEIAIYIRTLTPYISEKVMEQLTVREQKILNVIYNCDMSSIRQCDIYSLGGMIINLMYEVESDEEFFQKQYIKYCNQEKYLFNSMLITTYLELLGISFDIFALIIGAIEGNNPARNYEKVDGFIDQFHLPPLPIIRYKPTVKFDRMKAQEGEFIYQLYRIFKSQNFLSGEELKKDTRIKLMPQKIRSNTRLIITDKRKILKQLNYLGINRKMIYPDADNIAQYIREWNF